MRLAIPLLALLLNMPASAQQHDPTMHRQHTAATPAADAKAPDARQWVSFPEHMKEHTLSNMRDHLLALQEIQSALAASDRDSSTPSTKRSQTGALATFLIVSRPGSPPRTVRQSLGAPGG